MDSVFLNVKTVQAFEPVTFAQHTAYTVYAEAEGAIAWNDPTLAIDWQIPSDKVLLSEKDSHHPQFNNFVTPF